MKTLIVRLYSVLRRKEVGLSLRRSGLSKSTRNSFISARKQTRWSLQAMRSTKSGTSISSTRNRTGMIFAGRFEALVPPRPEQRRQSRRKEIRSLLLGHTPGVQTSFRESAGRPLARGFTTSNKLSTRRLDRAPAELCSQKLPCFRAQLHCGSFDQRLFFSMELATTSSVIPFTLFIFALALLALVWLTVLNSATLQRRRGKRRGGYFSGGEGGDSSADSWIPTPSSDHSQSGCSDGHSSHGHGSSNSGHSGSDGGHSGGGHSCGGHSCGGHGCGGGH